ncbi:MAG: hypothetical protein ACKO9H_18745 [Planctomycetota bacterium]
MPNFASSLLPETPAATWGVLPAVAIAGAAEGAPAENAFPQALHFTDLPANWSGSWYCFLHLGQAACKGMVQVVIEAKET